MYRVTVTIRQGGTREERDGRTIVSLDVSFEMDRLLERPVAPFVFAGKRVRTGCSVHLERVRPQHVMLPEPVSTLQALWPGGFR